MASGIMTLVTICLTTSTAIMMCYLNNTPEKFILSLADRARVVGLSATASKSVTGNYNLDYIQTKLGDKYYDLSQEDIKRITDYVKMLFLVIIR